MPEKLTTSGAKGVIAWSFEQAGKVKRPMTFYVGTTFFLLFSFLMLYLWPFDSEVMQVGAFAMIAAIIIADFYFVFRWASKRLDVNPKAFDGE